MNAVDEIAIGGVILLFVLFSGDPDLMDAIILWLAK
jgi:hypothetical protein